MVQVVCIPFYLAPLQSHHILCYPIISSAVHRGGAGASGLPDRVAMVTTTLQTLFLLERLRPKTVREVPTEAKLARLMSVFLIGRFCWHGDISLTPLPLSKTVISFWRRVCTMPCQSFYVFTVPPRCRRN